MPESMPAMITTLQIVMLSALFTVECREAAVVRVRPTRPSVGTRYTMTGLKPGETYVIERQLDPYEESLHSDTCQFTANHTSAHVPCTCAFNYSGDYLVRRSTSKATLAAFEIASIFDPASAQIQFSEPRQRLFESLTINISLRRNSSTSSRGNDAVESTDQLCSDTIPLSVCLDYQANVTLPSHHTEWQCVHRQEIIVLRTRAANVAASFDCASLSTPGFYRVSVDNALMSQAVFINGSSVQPTLSLRSGSIFPYCNRDFVVSWTLPQCHQLQEFVDFRLRIYSVADAVLDEWNYLEEFPVGPGDRSLSIPCSQFDILYEKFCFELVSVDRKTKKFHQWARRCINTEPVPRIDGAWTTWSEWTPCSKVCGVGRRKRTRKCASPAPNRGRSCMGRMTSRELCNVQPCSRAAEITSTNSTDCDCGCTLTKLVGVLYLGVPPCSHANVKWTVPAQENAHLQVAVVDQTNGSMRLQLYQGNQELLIRKDAWGIALVDVPLVKEFAIVLTKDDFSASRPVNRKLGVYVEYAVVKGSMRPPSNGFAFAAAVSRQLFRCHSDMCIALIAITTIVLSLIIALTLALIPPVLCACVTQRLAHRKKMNRAERAGLLASYTQRLESEMLRSGETECTQISTRNDAGNTGHPATSSEAPQAGIYVTKRSIGIQLSCHSTPRIGRSARGTPAPRGGSSSGRDSNNATHVRSDASEISGELEYDYYEPAVPGSFLYGDDLVSDIDIDQIVRRETSGWVEEPPIVVKQDAHTQI